MKFERSVFIVLLGSLLLAPAPPARTQALDPGPTAQPESTAKRGAYDRHEIPGHYTVGFYADRGCTQTELKIEKDATEFEAWIGVSGDSTRIFSSVAMRLELPVGIELAGPIRWVPRSGLKETGDLFDPGITADFAHDCAQQKGMAPAVLGRIPLRILPGLDEATISPAPHMGYGLSVELCSDARAWPKPYADPVALHVRRSLSLWDRIAAWFD